MAAMPVKFVQAKAAGIKKSLPCRCEVSLLARWRRLFARFADEDTAVNAGVPVSAG